MAWANNVKPRVNTCGAPAKKARAARWERLRICSYPYLLEECSCQDEEEADSDEESRAEEERLALEALPADQEQE